MNKLVSDNEVISEYSIHGYSTVTQSMKPSLVFLSL